LAIGIPGEDVGSIPNAGAVAVLYGSSSGLSATSPISDQLWTQNSPNVQPSVETGDNFGNSLSSGDFNGDGKDDLAIGVIGEDLGSITDAGAVEVLYGSSSGLSATSPIADQLWTQDSANVNDPAEASDGFGFSLSSGDFNGDGRDELAIGVPLEDGPFFDTGAVQVLHGSSSGLSATSPIADQFWTQDSANVDNAAEASDRFGRAVSTGDFNGDGRDDLAIGIQEEDLGSIVNAGAVEVIYGSLSGLSATSPRPDQFWTQDSPDVFNGAEQQDSFGISLTSGDFNADGKDDLAIGVPFEDITPLLDAGVVQVIHGSSSGLSATSPIADQFWFQNSADVADTIEANDLLGASVYSADFNGDGKDDLAIGIPFEALGSISDAGVVEVLYGFSSGLSATSPRPDQFWTQDSTNVNDVAEASDGFGNPLA